MADVSIYWFRDDLRLTDLPGLKAAANAGPVLPVFVLDPELGDPWILGGASRWWLHHSLKAIAGRVKRAGTRADLTHG